MELHSRPSILRASILPAFSRGWPISSGEWPHSNELNLSDPDVTAVGFDFAFFSFLSLFFFFLLSFILFSILPRCRLDLGSFYRRGSDIDCLLL